MRPQVTETSLLAFHNITESGRIEAWANLLLDYMENPANDSTWGAAGLCGSELTETLRKRQIELFQARKLVRMTDRTSTVTSQMNKSYRAAKFASLMSPNQYEWFYEPIVVPTLDLPAALDELEGILRSVDTSENLERLILKLRQQPTL